MLLQIKLLTDTAKVPLSATQDAAGCDLFADEDIVVPVSGYTWVRTGIAIAIPSGYVGQIWPRSGLGGKYGVDTGAGVGDPDYRGELKVLLFNHGEAPVFIKTGDRIAQLLIQLAIKPEFVVVDALPETARGAGGFGSTG